jgi:rod shape-determining protein MreD
VSGWVAYPVIALLVAAQTSLAPGLEIGHARPHLVLCWLVGWAAVRGRGEAIPWAIFGGLLLDLLSAAPLGSHLVALTAATYLADLGHRVIHGSTALYAGIAILGASVLYGGLLLLTQWIAGTQLGGRTALTAQILPGALYNLVVMIPFFWFLRGVDRRFPVPVAPVW